MYKYIKTTLVATAVLLAGTASALTAQQSVQKEIISINADGSETISYVSAEKVIPGERIAYLLDFANDQSEPATDLKLVMPVPEVITFNEGSARGEGTIISYSVDGETFMPREALRVALDDGKSRPAVADDITHIRWVIAGPVQPGEKGQLAFSGTLK